MKYKNFYSVASFDVLRLAGSLLLSPGLHPKYLNTYEGGKLVNQAG